jgi:hypothetical protein
MINFLVIGDFNPSYNLGYFLVNSPIELLSIDFVVLYVAQKIINNAIPRKIKTEIVIIDDTNEIYSLFENLISRRLIKLHIAKGENYFKRKFRD